MKKKSVCNACKTKEMKCELYDIVGELCLCGNCIIKMICSEKCTNLIKQTRLNGVFIFDKRKGRCKMLSNESIKKQTSVRLSIKRKRINRGQ